MTMTEQTPPMTDEREALAGDLERATTFGGEIGTILLKPELTRRILAALRRPPLEVTDGVVEVVARAIEAALCRDGDRHPGAIWRSERGREQMLISARAALAALQSLPRPASPSPDSVREVGRFYIDCEFDGHAGPLLSFAIVAEDGRGMHYRVVGVSPADPWVAENVVPLMGSHHATESHMGVLDSVGWALRHFIGDCARPVIIADSPVDIGRFCAAISTGDDGGWASADYPQMTFEVHNVDCYPTDLPGAVQHNAWWDAMALRHRLTPNPIVEGREAGQ